MAKEIDLYGRKIVLEPVWFLSQGYCQATTAHCLTEIDAGNYDPDKFAVWLVTHIVTCEQCTDANIVKDSIITFLREEHEDWVDRYKQGYLPPSGIIKGWIETLSKNPQAMSAYMRVMQNIVPHIPEFERKYGG